MAETMEQYMSKTRTDYGSGVARTKIDNKDQFELKGQFLKELRENTFSSSDNEDENEHIEKVLEIVDLFHVPNITRKKYGYYTSTTEQSRKGDQKGGGYRATALGYYQRNNANPSYQERRKSMEDTLSKFMSESAKRHEENSNLIKEIRATTDAAIRNQGASIKTLEIQIGQISKVLQERGFGSLPSSTKTNPRDQVKSISTTIKADSYSIRRIGSSQYAVSTGQNSNLLYKSRQTTIPFPSRLDNHYCEEEEGNYGPKFMEAYGASHINNAIPRKEKDPRSFTLPCFINNTCFDNALVDLGASISVMPLLTYLNLGLGELAHTRLTVELADRTVKYPKGVAENILVGIRKFTFLLDFIILDMPKDIKVPLILERPFLSTAHDFAVLENMEDYRDEGMGDVIFGEPFLREVGIKARRFEGMITLYKATTNFKANHVDAYDSDCDDEAIENAIFITNLSHVGSLNDDTVKPHYDSDIHSKVHHYDTYHDSDMLNSNIQELGYIENIVSNNESYDELKGNNNVITYTDYMLTIGNDENNYVPPHV
ncbi:hypothetical protein Tco_1403467 [Tanacetum coccineum]